MTPERWQQVKGVLENVLEITPPERDAFLDQACDGDQELRREVESLLAAGDEGRSSFLQSLPVMGLGKGTRVGDYEIQSCRCQKIAYLAPFACKGHVRGLLAVGTHEPEFPIS